MATNLSVIVKNKVHRVRLACKMHNIDQRQLGTSELVVPALGVGLASWGEALWGYGRSYAREDITQAYRACLDAGLNFFDTAGMYAGGESERLLGECHRADGRPIVIASKFAPLPMRSSAQDLLKALDDSLERLGIERIDLYQIHMPTSPRTVDVFMDALAKAVQAGKEGACSGRKQLQCLLDAANSCTSGASRHPTGIQPGPI